MFKPEHQPSSFRELIQQIYTCRALSVIDLMIEEYRVLFDDVLEQKSFLNLLLSHSRDLDYIQMLCAEYLGHTDHAKDLAVWINTRHQRSSAGPWDPLLK